MLSLRDLLLSSVRSSDSRPRLQHVVALRLELLSVSLWPSDLCPRLYHVVALRLGCCQCEA